MTFDGLLKELEQLKALYEQPQEDLTMRRRNKHYVEMIDMIIKNIGKQGNE